MCATLYIKFCCIECCFKNKCILDVLLVISKKIYCAVETKNWPKQFQNLMHIFEIFEILKANLIFGKGQSAPFSKNYYYFEF